MASNRSPTVSITDVQARRPAVKLSLSRVGVTDVEKVIRIRQNGSEQLFSARFECVVEDCVPEMIRGVVDAFPDLNDAAFVLQAWLEAVP